MPSVLVVEDDAAVRDILQIALTDDGFDTRGVSDGEQALECLRPPHPFDLVILDVMLPGTDGIAICQRLRRSSDVPVIMLTARDDETSVVVGLEVGADDYVTKPFSPRELISRVRANLRRRSMDTEGPGHKLEFPDLVIDLLRHRVLLGGEPVDLTTTQFEILRLLASQPGRIYDRQQIMEQVWSRDFYHDSRAVDTHIRHIRRKLEADPKEPRYVQTVRGAGYRFAER